jgi:hypothetical protein
MDSLRFCDRSQISPLEFATVQLLGVLPKVDVDCTVEAYGCFGDFVIESSPKV